MPSRDSARHHTGRSRGARAGRDQAFQGDRHHRHGQEHGDPGDAEAALARGDRAVIADPGRRLSAAILRSGPRRCDAQSLRRALREVGSVRGDQDAIRRRAAGPLADTGSRRPGSQLARLCANILHRGDPPGARSRSHGRGELYRLLVAAERRNCAPWCGGTPAQPFLEEHNSRMFDSIRSVTSSAVGALEYIATAGGTGFSVRDWVAEERPGVLFMPYKAGQIAALRSTISAWMRLAIFEAMDQTDRVQRQEPAGKKRAVVRRRRAGCAGTDRRTQGCARAAAKIRRPLRPGLSIDRPGFQHLRSG